MKKLLVLSLAAVMTFTEPAVLSTELFTITAEAHSGRTDANGGHRDNKNKSGLGSYHYHCGGYPAHLHSNGVCPYAGGSSLQGTSGSSAGAKDKKEADAQPSYDYSLVFDADYYAAHHEDVADHCGADSTKLLNHFLESGMKEGRQASEEFNVSVYKENNPDLAELYGDDLVKYYEHYMSCGHSESRVCK